MVTINKASFFRIKSSLPASAIADYRIPKTALGKIFKIETKMRHYTELDYSFFCDGVRHIIPSEYCSQPDDNELVKINWLCHRPLDITRHHRTSIFS